MQYPMIFSWEFYNKVLTLAEFLVENSEKLINQLNKMPLFDENDEQKCNSYKTALKEIEQSSRKLKNELIIASHKQDDLLKSYELFKCKCVEISRYMKRFNSVFNEVSRPEYYIDANGKLIHNNIN